MIVPVRFQLRRTKGYRMADAVDNGLPCRSVARPGPFGNPYTVTDAMDAGYRDESGLLSKWCVSLFRVWIGPRGEQECSLKASKDKRTVLLDRLPELRNTNLGCYCKLCDEHTKGKPCGVVCDKCAPCHGDPLLIRVSELPT